MLWPAVHRPQILALLLERGADLKRAPGCLELATSIISTESVQILLANKKLVDVQHELMRPHSLYKLERRSPRALSKIEDEKKNPQSPVEE